MFYLCTYGVLAGTILVVLVPIFGGMSCDVPALGKIAKSQTQPSARQPRARELKEQGEWHGHRPSLSLSFCQVQCSSHCLCSFALPSARSNVLTTAYVSSLSLLPGLTTAYVPSLSLLPGPVFLACKMPVMMRMPACPISLRRCDFCKCGHGQKLDCSMGLIARFSACLVFW